MLRRKGVSLETYTSHDPLNITKEGREGNLATTFTSNTKSFIRLSRRTGRERGRCTQSGVFFHLLTTDSKVCVQLPVPLPDIHGCSGMSPSNHFSGNTCHSPSPSPCPTKTIQSFERLRPICYTIRLRTFPPH